MKVKNKEKNRKGQIYIVSVIITIVFAIISAIIIINYNSSEKSKDEYIGVYQSAMVDAINEGDKLLIYLEHSAKYVAKKSLDESLNNGFVSFSEQSGEDEPGPRCGTYVYPLWNTESGECFPHLENGFGYFFDKNLNERLSSHNDINMKKSSDRKYYFDSELNKTRISAISEDQYIIKLYKSVEYKEKEEIKEYTENKLLIPKQNFIWPYKNNFKIISCFGSRNFAGGSEPHPGIDIPAPVGTPIYAVASGKVINYEDSWGGIYIDHGSGLKTVYGHTIKQYVKVGDTVQQGQHIADTGGRQYGRNNARGSHLHFEVIQDNIDLRTEYKGISAIISKSNKRRINPLCMYGKKYFEENKIPLDYEKNFGCANICNPDKNTCTDTSSCDQKYGCLFKFCEAYNLEKTECQTKENKEWKITNVMVSEKKVSGDKTIKIILTIENPSSECVSVSPKPIFNSPKTTQYEYDTDIKENVYKEKSGLKYKKIEVTCSFITDSGKLSQERGKNKCVLLAPSDDSTIKYTVEGRAFDAKNRDEIGTKVEFEVSKPQTVQGTGGTNIKSEPNIKMPLQLSPSEKNNLEITKKNLESQKILQYVIDIANKENVPPEIVLGLITQESKGQINAMSPTGATGMFQVIRSYHEGRVKKECGSWEKFKTDGTCQVRVGVGILKQYYKQYEKKGLTMKCTCEGNKGTKNCKPIDTTYTGWNAALRAYNSAGCHEWADYNFVDSVMKYASGWGYSGVVTQISEYQQVAADEIESKGILGNYYINPSFTVDVPFDISLVRNLSLFMNKTVNECRNSNLNKEECLNNKIDEFNKDVGEYYRKNGLSVNLTRECGENNEEKVFNEFIESVENCALSKDFDCQCMLKNNNNLKINIDSKDASALLSFKKSGILYSVESYNTFLDQKNNPLKLNAPLKEIAIYKKLGYLKYGKHYNNFCSVPVSRFKLCLKTSYEIEDYDGQSLKSKNLTLKFSVTIKDNDPPPPLKNVQLYNMKNSKNTIIVTWDEPKINNQKVPDVAKYMIYMSDIAADFNNNITTIRKNLRYRTIELSNGYKKVINFNITQEPECQIIDDKYCKFIYSAEDENGDKLRFEILPNELYYLKDKETFLYVLNGSDPYNAINEGREKYIAVTAVDIDNNEINNINESEKITYGTNLKSIISEDNLAPGFVKINTVIANNLIIINYNPPEHYINGEKINNIAITYKVYTQWNCPSKKNESLCDITIPYAPLKETGQLTTELPLQGISKVGIIAAKKQYTVYFRICQNDTINFKL